MARRTPDERRRAAEERAARRARARARPSPSDAGRPAPATARPSPVRGRPRAADVRAAPAHPPHRAVAERQPISRAARAQRVGRPGRPTLPPSSPKPRRWFRRFLAAARAAVHRRRALRHQRDVPAVPAARTSRRARVAGADPRGRRRPQHRRAARVQGRRRRTRASSSSTRRSRCRRGKLITGNYVLRRNMTNGAAIDALMQGPKVARRQDVQGDGARGPRRAARRRRRSTRAAIEGSYLKAADRARRWPARARLGAPKGPRTLEGFLFPATYDLKAGATADDLVDKQLDAFRDNFGAIDLDGRQAQEPDALRRADHRLADRARDAVGPRAPAGLLGDLQPAQDGRAARDRRDHPLRREQLDRAAQRSELESDTPYNTRIRAGLPPTPIGNPGLASMKAAAKPAKTDYLFYVVKPGACHAFAETLRAARAQRGRLRGGAEGERRQGAAAEVLTYLGRRRLAGRALAVAGDAERRARGRRAARLALPASSRCRPSASPRPCARCRAAGFRGLNVTIPHKEAALALADEATRPRAAVGAANTLTFQPAGAIHADNTDAPGLLEALPRRPRRADRAGARRGRRGAGGRVRAARRRSGGRDGLEPDPRAGRRGSSRSSADAPSTAPEPAASDRQLHERRACAKPTPVQEPAHPGRYVGRRQLRGRTWSTGPVAPRSSPRRERGGRRWSTGLEILVAQGAASFERWTDMTAPRQAMRAAVDHDA